MAAPRSRRRQPLLFATASPLMARFGAEFIGSLPSEPGVYFFYDETGKLLYIGQSGCLKNRLGSYRHVGPDRHPRRTLRLIQRTADIQWSVCGTPAEAVAMEAALLLEHRPPFNRAGVWPSAAWWLVVRAHDGWLHLELTREPQGAEAGDHYGPLPGSFRAVFGPLARYLYHGMHPASQWWDFRVGLLNPWPAPCFTKWEGIPGLKYHRTHSGAHFPLLAIELCLLAVLSPKWGTSDQWHDSSVILSCSGRHLSVLLPSYP